MFLKLFLTLALRSARATRWGGISAGLGKFDYNGEAVRWTLSKDGIVKANKKTIATLRKNEMVDTLMQRARNAVFGDGATRTAGAMRNRKTP